MSTKESGLILLLIAVLANTSICQGQNELGTNFLGIANGNYLVTYEIHYKQKGSLLLEGGYKNPQYGIISNMIYPPINVKKMEDVFIRIGGGYFCFSSDRNGFFTEAKIDFRYCRIQLNKAPDKDSVEAKGLVFTPMIVMGYKIKFGKLGFKPLLGFGYHLNFMNFDKIGTWPEKSFWLAAEDFAFHMTRKELLEYKKGFMPFMQFNVSYTF